MLVIAPCISTLKKFLYRKKGLSIPCLQKKLSDNSPEQITALSF